MQGAVGSSLLLLRLSRRAPRRTLAEALAGVHLWRSLHVLLRCIQRHISTGSRRRHLPSPCSVICQQTGEVSAAAGAGIYFEERRGLLTSLWLLLQAQVGSPPLHGCDCIACIVAELMQHGTLQIMHWVPLRGRPDACLAPAPSTPCRAATPCPPVHWRQVMLADSLPVELYRTTFMSCRFGMSCPLPFGRSCWPTACRPSCTARSAPSMPTCCPKAWAAARCWCSGWRSLCG